MVPVRVQANVLAAGEGRAAARAEQLDLDGPGRPVAAPGEPVPGGGAVGEADEQGLQGVGDGGARLGVAQAAGAVGGDDGLLVEVCWAGAGVWLVIIRDVLGRIEAEADFDAPSGYSRSRCIRGRSSAR